MDKDFEVTIIRSTLWKVRVQASDAELAEMKALEMETKELIEVCEECETTDLYCQVEAV